MQLPHSATQQRLLGLFFIKPGFLNGNLSFVTNNQIYTENSARIIIIIIIGCRKWNFPYGLEYMNGL